MSVIIMSFGQGFEFSFFVYQNFKCKQDNVDEQLVKALSLRISQKVFLNFCNRLANYEEGGGRERRNRKELSKKVEQESGARERRHENERER